MTDEKPPADDAVRAGVEAGTPVEPAGPPAPDPLAASVSPSTTDPLAPLAASKSPSAPDARAEASVSDSEASVTESEDAATVSRDRVTVRRSPRYGRFIVLGVGVGAIVTFVLTNLFEIDPAVGFGALFGYLLLFGVPIGAALGGLLAVVLDAVTSRRARTLEAERTTVDPTPEDVEGDVED